MPRQPRYFIPGFPQHVIARGVDRQAVFFSADDYGLYLSVLRGAARAHGCHIHAYVLMSNHVHLLMTPQTERAIPLVFQAIGRGYVQAINRQYERTGTLWEGRYKASIVDSAQYLLTCYRYIELNPVRAGLVASPDRYPFSSYGSNALGKNDPLVTAHQGYLALAARPRARQKAYRQLFEEAIGKRELRAIRDCANASQVLGNSRFKDQLEAMLGRSVRPGRSGRPRKHEGGKSVRQPALS